jgi:hypothetical protein
MIIFSACMALAIYFRRRPEYYRRLIFMASCQLMQATFVRFHYIGYHDLFYPALDVLIVAGNVPRPSSRWASEQDLSLRFPANDSSAVRGHVLGARESELVASRNAGGF